MQKIYRKKFYFIHEIFVSIAINFQQIDNLHSKASPTIVVDVVNAAEASIANFTDEGVGAVADAVKRKMKVVVVVFGKSNLIFSSTISRILAEISLFLKVFHSVFDFTSEKSSFFT